MTIGNIIRTPFILIGALLTFFLNNFLWLAVLFATNYFTYKMTKWLFSENNQPKSQEVKQK